MMGLYWRDPLWLLIILYPLLIVVWQSVRQRRQALSYADTALLPWVKAGTNHWRRYIRAALWGCFWLLFAIALAGPRLPLNQSEAQSPPDKEIMVVVDVSRSMRTEDIAPNRLQRAGLELYEFLQMAQGSRIGIIVYAARPHLLVPATTDKKALRFYLDKLDTLVLPTLGSDPVAALQLAEKQLLNHKDPSLPGMLLWLTDGDIPSRQQVGLKKRVLQLTQAGLPLYILGIGTEDGEAVPVANQQSSPKWLEYQGKIVRSHLNSALLQQLGKTGKGGYSSVKDDESDWNSLYKNGIASSSQSKASKEQQQWRELYVWALLPAVFLLFILVTLPRSLLVFLLILSLPSLKPAHADTAFENGIKAYRSEDYGTAVKQFSSAVFRSKSDEERARTLHNLGNSYFQQGNYNAAIQVFRDALTYRPNHKPTLQNLALGETVQSELERRLAIRQRAEDDSPNEGNRLERLSNQLDWSQDSTRTWGESTNKVDALSLPTLPLDDARLSMLVNKGLKRLAEEGVSDFNERNKRQQSLVEARIAMQQIDDNPAAFWKRLFEIEEGFPGSLKAPKEVPGVLPW